MAMGPQKGMRVTDSKGTQRKVVTSIEVPQFGTPELLTIPPIGFSGEGTKNKTSFKYYLLDIHSDYQKYPCFGSSFHENA